MSPKLAIAVVLALLFAAVAGQKQQQQQQQQPSIDCAALRRAAGDGMKIYGIHQLHAVAVLQQNVLCDLRLEVQSNGRVENISSELQLHIASISKGMFAAALGAIDSKIPTQLFTTPLKDIHGEDFWFLDHERSKLVTVDDLLSHSTGLARHDTMWYMKAFTTKADIVKHTSRLKPSGGFITSFIYNNLVWTLADLTVERLTGKNFTSYMRDFLWRPLGMSRTCGKAELVAGACGTAAAPAAGIAAPSSSYRSHAIPFDTEGLVSDVDPVEASGGILTTLPDMTRYIQYHNRFNYSSYSRPLPHFRPMNSRFWASGFNSAFHPSLYAESVTDLPQLNLETYTRGWGREWYRNSLVYSHSGGLFGLLCNLDLHPELQLGIFSHMTLGATAKPTSQALFASTFNKYVADLLLRNSSFITDENRGSLFKEPEVDRSPVSVPRRMLSSEEISAIAGEYGNFGMGTATLHMNSTSGLFNAEYGIAKLQLHAIQLRLQPTEAFEFVAELLEPRELASRYVMNVTSEVVVVPKVVIDTPNSFFVIRRQGRKLLLEAPAMEVGLQMEKGLRPESWVRPQICDKEEPKAAARTDGRLLLLLLPLLLAAMPAASGG